MLVVRLSKSSSIPQTENSITKKENEQHNGGNRSCHHFWCDLKVTK
jgi:hypothetical protein